MRRIVVKDTNKQYLQKKLINLTCHFQLKNLSNDAPENGTNNERDSIQLKCAPTA